jgi:hypothetical protein
MNEETGGVSEGARTSKRHTGESRYPENIRWLENRWTPAFAGVTTVRNVDNSPFRDGVNGRREGFRKRPMGDFFGVPAAAAKRPP